MDEEAKTVPVRRATRSADQIRAAFLRLIDRKQFEEITIKDIISEAEIGLATFYRHFQTKAALLQDVAASEIDAFVEMAVTLLSTAGSRQSSEALVGYVAERRAIWSTLLSGGAAGAMREGFIRRVEAAYKDEQKLLETWVPPELGVAFGVTATVEIIAWWLRQPEEPTVQRIAELLEGLAIQPALRQHRSQSAPEPHIRLSIDATIRLVKPD